MEAGFDEYGNFQDEMTVADVTIFHIDGRTITNDLHSKSDTICAKLFHYPYLNLNRYYVKAYAGQLYDPQAISKIYKNHYTWSFRSVSKEIFDLYIAFLGYKDKPKTEDEDEVHLRGRQYLKVRAERLL